MAVPMDSSLAPSSWERAELLYKKNIELENGLRKSAQMKVPSDPNIWFQMRENYEAIVLEDHDFSEKHEIEYVLWQLHYRRIEEFRARINATPPAGSIASQGGKNSANMERIKRIRSAFKSFLSEATGFYHDLILKIRSNYGLPLGYFSEESENQILPMKDEKRMAEMKKGLISCHRCLIYLGDLARYKGLYGEGDSVKREYAAASSYYKQAASLCPSSGNTHHQLAILASYFGDDLLAVYHYFRSLAVDIPFSTARDNLIIAFEKNRQNYSQLPSNTKAPAARILPIRSAGRGRGRDPKVLAKEPKTDASPVKEREPTIPEIFKAFSTRFVRLNGILFTRTSLETFGEIFSSVISDLHDLVSSGPEEELNFGSDAAENALIIVRLITILIFTVHNVKRESEGLSYAEILQRTLLLKNAFTAAFEFVGHILKRCIELHDIASSTYLPAILVYIEWLACHPDIAAGSDIEEKQSKARSFFWNQCIFFLNKLILTGLASVDSDDDDNCFSDMSMYDEGETGNRLALWEDFELRGFLPLVPAQVILNFSRKHAFESGSIKEKSTRVQRILAAGRALMNVVQIDQQRIYFDPYSKKFMMSIEPPEFEAKCTGITDIPVANGNKQGCQLDDKMNIEAKLLAAATQSKAQLYVEGEEDEEVIVFKPNVAEKYPSITTSVSPSNEYTHPVQVSAASWATNGALFTTPLDNGHLPNILNVGADLQTVAPQLPPHYASPETSKWLLERQAFLSDGLKNLNFGDNGLLEQGLQKGLNGLQPQSFAPQISAAVNSSNTSVLYNQIKAAEVATSSVLHYVVPSGSVSDATSMNFTAALPAASKKNPVSRPVRHIGPPPGFSHVPLKQQDDPISSLTTKDRHPQVDDYSWLDGYQPPSTKAVGMDNYKNSISYMYPSVTAIRNNAVNATTGFPFPGKQVSGVPTHVVNENKWQDFQLFEQLKPYAEQQLQQAHQQNSLLPEQQPAQSLWSDRYFV